MNRSASLFLSIIIIFTCSGVAQLVTPPNVAPVVTNPMPNYDQLVDTTRAIDLSAFFTDPDSTTAATLTTSLGPITITLDSSRAPATVANFLNYINSNRYFITDPTNGDRASTFFHRAATSNGTPFVIQGGGFLGTVNPNGNGAVFVTDVVAFPPVQNEPFISNIRGTVAMAKLGGNPNSATTQWFINLSDNSANLDIQNGGFTVFGHVTGNGMAVADAIYALPRVNAGSPFDSLPVRDFVSSPLRVPNLVSIPEFRTTSPLAYTASSSNSNVASVSVSGGHLVVTGHQVGSAQVTVSGVDLDGAGPVSQSFTVNMIAAPGRLRNISTRANIGTGDNVLIAGFIIRGGTSKQVVVRAIGPSLSGAGVPNAMQNPSVRLLDGTGQVIATSDDWVDSPNRSFIEALGLGPQSTRESALVFTLPSSAENHAFTAIMEGAGQTTGVGLIEVFDVDSAPGATILNLSTRGEVSTGDDVMIGGVIVGGGESKRFVFRAIGPSLANSGIGSPLNDPAIRLVDSQGTVIDTNDNWETHPQAMEMQRNGLAPTNSAESAVLATLPAGSYTAIVSGNAAAPTGVGLVEVFQLP